MKEAKCGQGFAAVMDDCEGLNTQKMVCTPLKIYAKFQKKSRKSSKNKKSKILNKIGITITKKLIICKRALKNSMF